MSKEELIKLKTELLTETKYVLIDEEGNLESSYPKTERMINKSLQTDEAVKEYENLLELFLKICVLKEVSFDSFDIKIYPMIYVKQDFLEEENINITSVLPDILNLRFSIYAKEKNKNKTFENLDIMKKMGINVSLDDYCYRKEYTVNYNEFVSKIKNLGYEIKNEEFTSIVEMFNSMNGEVDFSNIDFTEEKILKK